jgi:hypothetical protein
MCLSFKFLVDLRSKSTKEFCGGWALFANGAWFVTAKLHGIYGACGLGGCATVGLFEGGGGALFANAS